MRESTRVIIPRMAESSAGGDSQRPGKKPEQARGQQRPDPAEERGGCQDRPPVAGRCPELDEGLERHDEQAGADPEEDDQREDDNQAGRCGMEEKGGYCQADGADGHYAEFHIPAREMAGQERSGTDPHGRGNKEIAAPRLGKPQIAHAVGEQVQLAEGGDKEEVGGADDRQEQVAVAAQPTERLPVDPGMPGKRTDGVGNRGNRQGAGKGQAGQGDDNAGRHRKRVAAA